MSEIDRRGRAIRWPHGYNCVPEWTVRAITATKDAEKSSLDRQSVNLNANRRVVEARPGAAILDRQGCKTPFDCAVRL